MHASRKHSAPYVPAAQQPELISPGWLVRGFLLTVLAAALLGYLTLCLLFWQGQWQIVFHPSREIRQTPASVGIPFDDISFHYTETGHAQLNGWWIPAYSGSRYAGSTILLFHGSTGNMQDTLPTLRALHTLGFNVFAFDYRGFGKSLAVHPSEERTRQDAEAAWTYLTDIRHLPPASVIVYGQGLGASVAADLAGRHNAIRAVLFEDPSEPALTTVHRDARTHILPVTLLFHDRFDFPSQVREVSQPKLWLLAGKDGIPEAYQNAPSPKRILFLAGASPGSPIYDQGLLRFFDEQVSRKTKITEN